LSLVLDSAALVAKKQAWGWKTLRLASSAKSRSLRA
jgi:hypothetical protein